jgi:hypothetical protein
MLPDESCATMANEADQSALKATVAAAVELTDKIETTVGGISIGTMHRAKRSELLSCRYGLR